MNILTMQEIERMYDSGTGRHWFDRDTMRFFRCRLAQFGYQNQYTGKVYFVSSEKGPHGRRMYSVRVLGGDNRMVGEKHDVKTIGEFQAYASGVTAHRYARKLAEGNISADDVGGENV